MLAFFPAAFSSVCAKEMRTFHDHEKLSFPLLSDFYKQVIREYGVFHEDMIGLKGIAKRAVIEKCSKTPPKP